MAPAPSRRRLLGAVAGAASLAGCLDGTDADPAVRIDRVALYNDGDAARTVTLTVSEGGSQLFSREVRLAPGEGKDVDAPVQGSGSYVVTATSGEQEASVDLSEAVDSGTACVVVDVRLRAAGDLSATATAYDDC